MRPINSNKHLRVAVVTFVFSLVLLFIEVYTASAACSGPSFCFCREVQSGSGVAFTAEVEELGDGYVVVRNIGSSVYCSGEGECSEDYVPEVLNFGGGCGDLLGIGEAQLSGKSVFFADYESGCLVDIIPIIGSTAYCEDFDYGEVELVLQYGLLPLVECQIKWAEYTYELGWKCEEEGCACSAGDVGFSCLCYMFALVVLACKFVWRISAR